MKKIKWFLTICLSLLLVIPPNAFAEIVGTITYTEGRVDKLDAGGKGYLPVVAGDKVSSGDAIRTKTYSKAEITFDDDSIVRLGSTSQIKVKEYDIDELGQRKKGVIDLDRGRIRAIVSRAKDKTAFDINTLNASGSVMGSDVFVSYQKSATGILVLDGVLRTINPAFPDNIINIREGNASFVPYNAPPQDPRTYLPMEKERYELETGPTIREIEGILEGEEITRAKVRRITGVVKIQPADSKSWHAPLINEVLNVGDKIVTEADGKIEISLDNGHILELKPNTQIILTILTVNPKTGDYENEVKCERGKVIAKLRKIEGKSSFKIKTPTVTCGVRGTLMYIEVLPNWTKVFFEGGDGFITNLISGITKIVNAGQTGSGDNQGNVTDPTGTTDEERSKFGSGWGSEGGDTYGYTPPPGDVGDDLSGTGGGTGVLGTEGGTESPFSNVPITELISTGTGTGAAPGPVLTFAGTADGSFGHYVFLDLGTDTPGGERHLYEVYNALYGTSYPDNNAIEFLENGPAIGKGRFTSSGGSMYFVARYAGAKLNMKLYDIKGEYDMVINLSGRSDIYTLPYTSYPVPTSESFGIWGQGSGLPRFYSEKMMNDDNEYHFIVLNAPVEYPDTYLIGFEDKSSGSDWDYNDFVFEIVDILPDYDATNIALLEYGQLSFAFGGTGAIIGSDIPFGIIGDYSNPNKHTLWGSDFNGLTNDGATLLGSIGGISLDDSLEGLMLGMYVRPDDGIYRAGYINSSNITGLFDPTSGLFLGSGNMTSYLDRPTSVLPEQLYFDSPYLNTGFSRGNIRGDLYGTVSVETISLIDQNWGLWRAGFGGTDTPPNSPFRSAMAGGYSDNEHAWIGILSGDLDSGRIHGSFNGLLMFETEGTPGNVTAGTLSGDAIGTYIEVGEGAGTWQALGAGQWVEVTDLLDEESLFGTEGGLDILGDFVSVPITEVYSSILSGAGTFTDAGGAIQATMDTSLYATSPSVVEGIWSAIINGTYSGQIGDAWSATVANGGGDIATLSGNSKWSDNQWVADVSGKVDGNDIAGQAAGTYGDGAFTGLGAGTWEAAGG